MCKPKHAVRILLALAFYNSSAIYAYGWSSTSLFHPSVKQEELTMSFVAWIVLGLVAGYIGSQLVNRERILPDVFVGLAGAMAGGWLCYTFGPPGVNGFNLLSLIAAVIGSLIFLLTYYGLRRV
jgi:uncharacterized membrane protein YeaQ/YmgE (transglycosylase-associated protein family)